MTTYWRSMCVHFVNRLCKSKIILQDALTAAQELKQAPGRIG